MDYFDLSVKSKRRLARWINKRPRTLLISELVKNSRDERQLFKMCRYIDRWYDQHEGPVKKVTLTVSGSSQDDSGDTQEDIDEVIPDIVPEVKPETYVKPQKEISKKTKGRINEFIINHPGAPISEIVNNATDEAEILRAIEEMESRVVPVDTRIKLWTCVPSRRL